MRTMLSSRKETLTPFCLLFALLCASSVRGQASVEELEEKAVQGAVARVAPSVVRIETIGGVEKVGKLLVGTGPTTGLIVAADGYIVSSAFNFVQQPTSILVTLPSGKRLPAKIVARDHSRKLVLLKVDSAEQLTVPVAAPRREMQVGQWSIAVGKTFDQGGPNLSVGVLSATNRIWGKAIQTDAKISPANYGGPLIDIHGRVLGVLVPLSPQGESSELAGAEWYDSGIGFAAPLAEINQHLEALKAGKDLHAGVLGVSLKNGDIYALPAEVVACQVNSPAYKAGLKAGDTIIEVDGAPIARQAQLRHALGGRYAGEKLQVVALRGKDRIEAAIELVDKLEPYQHPFLGLLPLRGVDPAQAGVVIRYVYPGSPAAEAMVMPGDRLVALGDKPVADVAAAYELLAAHDPQMKLTAKFERAGEPRSVELSPTSLPTEVPAELPSAVSADLAPPAEKPAIGLAEIKLPEEKNECVALVPQNYHPEVPHGLVVVLHSPGKFERPAFEKRWQDWCAQHQVIALAPQSADPSKWEPTESDFVRKAIEHAVGHYNIDGARIVVFGEQTGGTMALLVGLDHANLIRGIATVDAALPARAKLPENDPVHRLAFYVAIADKSALASVVKGAAARLSQLKFPVTLKSLGEQPRELSTAEFAELGRWVDTLDRL